MNKKQLYSREIPSEQSLMSFERKTLPRLLLFCIGVASGVVLVSFVSASII
jgi:hypothetical protein